MRKFTHVPKASTAKTDKTGFWRFWQSGVGWLFNNVIRCKRGWYELTTIRESPRVGESSHPQGVGQLDGAADHNPAKRHAHHITGCVVSVDYGKSLKLSAGQIADRP